MFSQAFSGSGSIYKQFNILIVHSNRHQRNYLKQIIKANRSYHKILQLENIEEVLSEFDYQVTIDLIFFDIEDKINPQDLSLLKAIMPEVRLVNWSNCRHPELIELLYLSGVKSFCYKQSKPKIIIDAIDFANNNHNILYLDEALNNCLPLLKN